MKSIIIISTLLFVTASFMGIGSYIRYNNTLTEKGLYAAPQKENTETTVQEQEIIAEPNETIIEDNNEPIEEPVQQIENKKVVKAQPHHHSQQTAPLPQPSSHQNNGNVLHAARKPKEREINFESFSRAPLKDYPEPETVTEEITEAAPPVTINNEENE